MLYKGKEKNELPTLKEISELRTHKGYGWKGDRIKVKYNVYALEADKYASMYDRYVVQKYLEEHEEWTRTYVRYTTEYGKEKVGFVITDDTRAVLNLMRKHSNLVKRKYEYIFRRTPVPHTNYNKNYIHKVRAKSIMAEYNHTLMCMDELSEYNVVRDKRRCVVREMFDWDNPRDGRREKGWKRSKKRKQWM